MQEQFRTILAHLFDAKLSATEVPTFPVLVSLFILHEHALMSTLLHSWLPAGTVATPLSALPPTPRHGN